jgi:hypothetical protein
MCFSLKNIRISSEIQLTDEIKNSAFNPYAAHYFVTALLKECNLTL